MLRNIDNSKFVRTFKDDDSYANRYKRNEKDDVKIAIEYLYEFKKRLEELHPVAFDVVHKLLQEGKY